jgi:hypothetical protein
VRRRRGREDRKRERVGRKEEERLSVEIIIGILRYG